MKSQRLFGILVALSLAASPGCHQGGSSGKGTDGGDTDSETGTAPQSWDEATLLSASAPTETEVELSFAGSLPLAAGEAESYAISSDLGEIEVQSAAVQSDSTTVTLTTAEQKLGAECTVQVVEGDQAVEGLEAGFTAADTARFWIADFASAIYEKYEIVAERAAVGESCVVYIEQGWQHEGAQEAADRFDTQIYPVMTDLFIAPPDQDGNGRITLLGVDGEEYFGGYFDPTDAYPEEQTMAWWNIHSNEMEIVYINVAMGYFDSETVVPHEFQHLLYHERHGFQDPYWEYHDEGLAESAVRAVNGYHPWAVDYYFADSQGLIGAGLSLVNWTYAQYENYVLAYLFWNYVGSRLEGVETFGAVFDLPTGAPDEVDAFLTAQLGEGFGGVQRDQLAASWIRAAQGRYGYGEMISNFPGDKPPRVEPGTSSVDLEPFAGTFFELEVDQVEMPTSAGQHVTYLGIDAAGEVDLTDPYDVAGGALLVYNANLEWEQFLPEHSGPDLPASGGWKGSPPLLGEVPPTWLDPPPYNPYAPERMQAWKTATAERLSAR
ncbi:MAG: hypothetical protein R6V85_03200 [Polyangia bacterium]